MIDGLIGGKLYGKAAQRTGQNGHPFVTAKVRATGGDGDGDAIFVNVIAFSETAINALLALEDGDSVSISGSLTPKVWTDRNGETHPALDMVATLVMTAYQVKHKRATTRGDANPAHDADADIDDGDSPH
ncbi:single-stranded DNA-binding protein [Pandoraea apista]|uniref:Single-stranded DNA-binding protein n=1 Tax=Pandoraea apista TaxID=93218 RepID=A0ABX9ZTI3_9BURK|nr:single-stranded DNA-binding protein [Pandoraea apista]AJZ74807.1 single-stranded DNA-binding protein [Pandoraea apista]AKH72365.1 single-stranded DNA-binding protein [Pandoraea apista]AKI60756.1 single-stranded DNA-binding protein [Pandoraea apista]PTE02296.1 single-stranded DNA-binding protein [Pandoraea apista]RRJ34683.1 single-stranded DNA-binding protein [Pandoraea apista]